MAQHQNNAKKAQVIDDNLKRVYEDMLEQDVPDRFLDLLAQLREQDNSETDEDGSER
ncbi:NepR family anti-sigma factor [Litorisediminicola beolgyonensis]|uniref:NepR family anti-sigma factor n=1 Tax=Litorisediminicola beolgyonensis TaxID=1173614 RepID=A0ABW3ZJQ5_9RHOB